MWRFRRPYAGPIDVTAVGRTVRARDVRGHEVAALHRADKTVVRAIAVTSPARALLEIAPRLTPRELADGVEQAQVRRLVTKRDIAATLERAGARAGVRALRAVLEEPAFTRSRAERRLVALLRAAKLPQPAFNAVAEGFEVDALWRRERNRRRTAALQRGRYVVLRTTWRELTKQSHALIAHGGGARVLDEPATVSVRARRLHSPAGARSLPGSARCGGVRWQRPVDPELARRAVERVGHGLRGVRPGVLGEGRLDRLLIARGEFPDQSPGEGEAF